MPLPDNLSKYWLTIQRNLFPWLEEELGQLSTNERKLVTTLEMVRLEALKALKRWQFSPNLLCTHLPPFPYSPVKAQSLNDI